ncbi:MAG: DUF72 domain-containing protein [Armatimonadota bacterium]
MSRLFIGTSGWNYKHWRGVFYPDELAESEWLHHYSQTFHSVEINNSFYRLPEKKTFEAWYAQTPDDFTFSVKASRYLTHTKKLHEPEEALQRLLDHVAGLSDKLGIILYQLPPRWHVDLDRLDHFLGLLPPHPRSAFEFRDNSWQCEAVWSLLQQHGVAYCIMDSPGLPLHIKTTCDYSYIRLHSGGELTASDYTTKHLQEWAARIRRLLNNGDVYAFFNNDTRGYALKNASDLISFLI